MDGESQESVYAAEGTLAHEVAEQCLRSGKDAKTLCEDAEMAEAVQVYLDEISAVARSVDIITQMTEVTLECLSITGLGGTSDHAMLYRQDAKIILHLFDYKHGAGVPVYADENPQLLSYFVIFDSHFPELIDEYRGTIVQPRVHGDGISHWSCDRERVIEHKQAILESKQKSHLKAGDWCRWCPAATNCSELHELTMEAARADFNTIKMTPELAADVLAKSEAIQLYIRKVQDWTRSELASGRTVPGWKLVESLSNRRFSITEEEVVEICLNHGFDENEVVDKKVKSPAQLEKVVGKKIVSGITERVKTGTTMVPESDKRPRVGVQSVEQDFKDF